jgi:hypothetical protein
MGEPSPVFVMEEKQKIHPKRENLTFHEISS